MLPECQELQSEPLHHCPSSPVSDLSGNTSKGHPEKAVRLLEAGFIHQILTHGTDGLAPC